MDESGAVGNVSIHPPRVGRDVTPSGALPKGVVSIHPPRVGRDSYGVAKMTTQKVSIHPPRVGRDRIGYDGNAESQRFNPPSPCGEGLQTA